MASGFITYYGVGRLYLCEGSINSEAHQKIITEALLPSLEDHGLSPGDIIFQQDNAPCHASKSTIKILKDKSIKTLDWTSQSPDMNIIEHVWAYLKYQIRQRPTLPRNKKESWEVLQEEWYGLDIEYIRKLYDSIPRRFEALEEVKGGWTRY